MPFRREQVAKGADTTSNSSVSATFPNTMQNGSIILLAWIGNGDPVNSALTPTDSIGNTYIKVLSKAVVSFFDLEIWYAKNKSSAANTITVTDTNAAVNTAVIVEEWTGADSTTVVDASNSNSGTVSPLTPGSASNVISDALIWVAGVDFTAASDFTLSGSLSNLTQQQLGITSSVGIGSAVVASKGSYNDGFTCTTSTAWACAQVIIRKKPEGTTTSSSSISSTSSSISSTSSSTSSTSFSASSISTSSTSSSLSTSSTSSSTSSTSSSISSTSSSSTSASTSISSTSSSISSTSMSSTSQSSTSASTSISSTSSSYSSTSSSISSTSFSQSSTSFSSTSSSSSTSTTAIPKNLIYSYQDSLTLPTSNAVDIDADTNKNVQNVAIDDGDYMIQYGSEYMIQEYKKKWINNTDVPSFTWKGRTTYDTRISPLVFQIYNVGGVGARVTANKATGTGTSSVSATYPSTPTAGNLLIAAVGADSRNGVNAISGWTSVVNDIPTGGIELELFYKVSAGTEGLVSVTNGIPTSMTLAIYEYSGTSATPLDQFGQSGLGFGSTQVQSTGTTPTTTQASELVFAAVNWPSVTQTYSSSTNGFTSLDSVGSHLFTLDKIVSTTGTYQTSVTVTGTNGTSNGVIATFKIGVNSWETLAVINKLPPDTDYQITVTKSTNATNYYDSNNIVTFRVYQQVL